MSMHLNHLLALERTGGAVWRKYCQLRDHAGLAGSSSARELEAFCQLWQEHPARLKLECERNEAEVTVQEDDALLAEAALSTIQ